MDQAKEKILQISEELFMQYGLKSVSMDDVARNLGMSKKTIYNYIKDKKDLVYQVIQQHFSRNESRCLQIFDNYQNPVVQMLHIGRNIISDFKSLNPGLMYDLRKYFPRSWELMNEYKSHIIKHFVLNNLKAGKEQGYYRNDFNPEIVAELYLSLTETITQGNKINDNRNYPELFRELLMYHLHAISTDKGKQELTNNISLINN